MNAFMNNTDELITYKIWTMDPRKVTANHFPMLQSHDIKADLKMDNDSFTTMSGQRYFYGLGGQVEFVTSCEKQETVLKLLYGENLILKNNAIVPPHSIVRV